MLGMRRSRRHSAAKNQTSSRLVTRMLAFGTGIAVLALLLSVNTGTTFAAANSSSASSRGQTIARAGLDQAAQRNRACRLPNCQFSSLWAGYVDVPQLTTVAPLSNGNAINNAILNVVSTASFPPTGQINVVTSGGTALLNYTGTTPGSFTGVTIMSGNPAWTVATGAAVSRPFTEVVGTWEQPTAHCTQTDPAQPVQLGFLNIWPGMDGTVIGARRVSSTVEQTGTEAFCAAPGAAPRYLAWWEMVPGSPGYFTPATLPVKPNDVFTATVTYSAVANGCPNGEFTLTVDNQTRKKTAYVNFCGNGPGVNPVTFPNGAKCAPVACMYFPNGALQPSIPGTPPLVNDPTTGCPGTPNTCLRASAEWIVENSPSLPRWEKSLTLSNDEASNGGGLMAIPKFPPTYPKWLEGNNGCCLATVTGLHKGGLLFTAHWKRAGPN